MNVLLLSLIGVFLLVMIAIGVWVGREQKTAADFLIGGRRFGLLTTSATQIATAFGGGVMLAQVGIAYQYGFSVLVYTSVSVAGGVFILAKFFSNWLREQDFYTTSDWMCFRYGETKLLRGLTSGVVSIYSIAGWVAQPIAAGKVLEIVTGLPLEYGIAVSALVVILYTMTGGITAVAYTDVAQLGLMLIGLFVLLPVVVSNAGGFGDIFETVPQENLTLSAAGNDVLLAWLLAVLPAQVVKQTYHQRIFGAKDIQTARRGLYILSFAVVLAGFWAAFLGMAIYTLNPNLADREQATIWAIQDALPPVVAALTLAAIISAVVSSADSFLHSASASLTRDIYQKIFKPSASDKQLLSVSKLSIVVIGIAGVIIGISSQSVLQALLMGYSVTAAGLFFPLVLGHFWKRATASGAVCGIISGVAATIGFEIFGTLPSFLPPVAAGLAASLLGVVICSYVSPQEATAE